MNINSQSLRKKIGLRGPRSLISSLFTSEEDVSEEVASGDEEDILIEKKVRVKRDADHKVVEIFDPLMNMANLDIYVHGSWADNSKTPFSDLDDLIIVDEKSLSSKQMKGLKKKLKQTEIKFQQIDPLQHHGHWIISKSSLENYDASFIPLFILKDALRVKGRKEIRYTKNWQDTERGLKKNLIHTKKNIHSFYQLFNNRKINIYELKEFVGSVLLIPPLIFQYYKKLEIDKRTAINNSTALFGNSAHESIAWATKCRNEWGEITNSESYRLFSRFLKIISHPTYRRIAAKHLAPKLSNTLYKKWELEKSSLLQYLKEIEAYICK